MIFVNFNNNFSQFRPFLKLTVDDKNTPHIYVIEGYNFAFLCSIVIIIDANKTFLDASGKGHLN